MSRAFLSIYRTILAAQSTDAFNQNNLVVRAVRQGLDARVCSLWAVNHNAGTVSMLARSLDIDLPATSLKEADYVHAIEGSASQLSLDFFRSEKRPLMNIADCSIPPWDRVHRSIDTVRQLSLRQQIVIPIYNSDGINAPSALLNIYTRRRRSLTPDDATTLSMFIGKELDKQESLVREAVSRAILDSFERAVDINSALRIVVDDVLKPAFRAQSCELFLFNRHGTHLETYGGQYAGQQREISSGLVGECIRTGRSFLLPNLVDDEETLHRKKQALRGLPAEYRPVRTSMYISIRRQGAKEDVIGVLRFINRFTTEGGTCDYYSSSDVLRADYLATFLSLFIDRKINEEQKNGFLADLAHEVLHPAIGIRGGVEHLLTRRSDTFDRSRVYSVLQKISEQVWFQISIVHTLYRAWQLPQGIPMLDESEFDILDAIHSAKTVVIPIARDSGLLFDNIAITGENWVMRMRRGSLIEILVNLLSNAIKYADPRNKSEFAVTVRVRSTSDYITVTVEDRGVGIEERDCIDVFKRGYRGSSIRKISVRGLGLGLYVARNIAKDFSGRLILDSRKDPTRFVLDIPRSLATKPI